MLAKGLSVAENPCVGRAKTAILEVEVLAILHCGCTRWDGVFRVRSYFSLFGGLDSGKWVRSLHYAGTEISLGGGHSLDFYYLYHLYDKGGPTAACHLLGFGYIFVF